MRRLCYDKVAAFFISNIYFFNVLKRMETLDLRNSITQIKIIGTMLSISGALVAVLYKGPTIISSSPDHAPSLSLEYDQYLLGTSEKNWVIGGLLLVSQFLFTSTWYILQVTSTQKMLKGYNIYMFCKMFKLFIYLKFLWNLTDPGDENVPRWENCGTLLLFVHYNYGNSNMLYSRDKFERLDTQAWYNIGRRNIISKKLYINGL